MKSHPSVRLALLLSAIGASLAVGCAERPGKKKEDAKQEAKADGKAVSKEAKAVEPPEEDGKD